MLPREEPNETSHRLEASFDRELLGQALQYRGATGAPTMPRCSSKGKSHISPRAGAPDSDGRA